MRTHVLTVLAPSLFSVSVVGTQLTLQDLIPPSKWQKTGLHRLTDSEREELKAEIVRLVTQYNGEGIAVIAPSASTRRVANEVLLGLKKSETTNFRKAEAILVVVRSYSFSPLRFSYDSLKDLKRDAEFQLDFTGRRYHVYLYVLERDLSVSQLTHHSFEAGKD